MPNDFEPVGLEAILRGTARYLQDASRLQQANTRLVGSTGAAAASGVRMGFSFRTLSGILPGAYARLFITATAITALSAALLAGAKAAVDFETSLTRVVTLTDVTDEQIDSMAKAVRDLSVETGRAPQDLADSLFAIASAGATGAKANEILEQSAKASAVGLGQTEVIARTLVGTLAAYESQGLTAARATDILIATVNQGNVEADELAGTLGRVVGIAATVGISFEEVGAFLATFTRLGVDGSEAVTALRGTLSLLISPTQQARQQLAGAGLSMAALRDVATKQGLFQALQLLLKTFKGNEEAIADIIPNVRALAGILGTAGVQAEDYEEIVRKITDSQGDLDKAFERTSEDSAFKVQVAMARLRLELLDISSTILPAIITVLVLASDTFEILAAAVGPLLSILGVFAENERLVQVASAALAGIIITKLVAAFVAANAAALRSIAVVAALSIQMRSVAPAVAASRAALAGLAATALTGVIPALAGIAAGLAFFTLSMRGAGDDVDTFQAKLEALREDLKGAALDFRGLGLDEQESDIAAAIGRFTQAQLALAETRTQIAPLAEESGRSVEDFVDRILKLDRATGRARASIEDLTPANIALARQFKDQTSQADFLRDAVGELATGLDEVDLARTLVKGLQDAGFTTAQTIGIIKEFFPEVVSAALEAGQSIEQFAEDITGASTAAEQAKTFIENLTDAFSGLRGEVSKLLGIETQEEAALRLQISQRELQIAQIRAAADSTGGLSEATEQQIASIEGQIGVFKNQLEIISATKGVAEDYAVVTRSDLLPAQRDLFDLTASFVGQLAQQGTGFDINADRAASFRKALESAKQTGTSPLLADLLAMSNAVFTVDVDTSGIAVAQAQVDALLASALQVGGVFAAQAEAFRIGAAAARARRGQVGNVPIGPQPGHRGVPPLPDEDPVTRAAAAAGEAGARAAAEAAEKASQEGVEEVESVWARGARLWMEAVERGVREGRIGVHDAVLLLERDMVEAARSVVAALADQSDRVETELDILTQIVASGFIDIRDAQRLFEAGATEAGDALLRALGGRFSDPHELGREAMRELRDGILDGTADVFDALSFLERGMFSAAEALIRGLTERAQRQAEQWQVLIDVLQRGFITLADVNRLIEIGSFEAATALLRELTTGVGPISQAIFRNALAALGPRFPNAAQFQHGGFVPPGIVQPALLHGGRSGEIIVPLGNQSALLEALRRLRLDEQRGGFRNYGTVTVNERDDQESALLRSITRSLS